MAYDINQVKRQLKHELDRLCNNEKGFAVDDDNRPALIAAAEWLCLDPKDRRLGMFMRGPTGTGKTKLIEATGSVLRMMTGKGIRSLEAVELAAMASAKDGREALKRLADPVNTPHLCIEDLDTEKNAPSFVKGDTGINAVAELIQIRYKWWERGYLMTTHFTSNALNERLMERYGERAISRKSHMTFVVPLPGIDRRMGAVIPPLVQASIPYEDGPIAPSDSTVLTKMVAEFRSEHDLRIADRIQERAEKKAEYLDKMRERVRRMELAELHHVIQNDVITEARDIARNQFNAKSPVSYDQFLIQLHDHQQQRSA